MSMNPDFREPVLPLPEGHEDTQWDEATYKAYLDNLHEEAVRRREARKNQKSAERRTRRKSGTQPTQP